jgi:3-hydroxybutyryl-CoA dehydrogenase
MKIEGVAVIGAGVMGSGIAQVSAAADYLVTIQDVGEEALKRSKSIC